VAAEAEIETEAAGGLAMAGAALAKTPLTKDASVEERVAEIGLPFLSLAVRMICGTRRGCRAAL